MCGSNAEPCSHLTITVTLETSVPLLTRCSPAITISGLTEAVELAPKVVNVSREVNMSDFAVSYLGVSQNVSTPFLMQSFDRKAGVIVLRVENSTMAGITYVITFKLRHRAQESDGVNVGVSMEHEDSNQANHRSQQARLGLQNIHGYKFESVTYDLQPGPGDVKPMSVKRLDYRSFSGQTSFHPVIQANTHTHSLSLKHTQMHMHMYMYMYYAQSSVYVYIMCMVAHSPSNIVFCGSVTPTQSG